MQKSILINLSGRAIYYRYSNSTRIRLYIGGYLFFFWYLLGKAIFFWAQIIFWTFLDTLNYLLLSACYYVLCYSLKREAPDIIAWVT